MLENSPILYYLLASLLLYWLMLIFASSIYSKLWTWSGLLLAVGSRDQMPDRTRFMARADRAAKNMAENMIIFTAVALTAVVTGAPKEQALVGGQIFFFARLAYWPLYLAGVPWLRTLSWAVALVGVCLVAAGILKVRLVG